MDWRVRRNNQDFAIDLEGKPKARGMATKDAGEERLAAFGTASLQPGLFFIFKYLHFKILCPGHIPGMSAVQCFHIHNG